MNGFAAFGAIVAGLVAVVATFQAVSHRKTRQELTEAAWVDCRGAAGLGGRLVRICGVADALPAPGGVPAAPLSGAPAAWCSARVSRQESYEDSDGHRHTRTVTVAEMSGRPFLVRDQTGAVLVDDDRLTWHDLEPSVSARQNHLPPGLYAQQMAEVDEQLQSFGLSERWAGLGARLVTGSGGPYDVVEYVVQPGTPIVVLGTTAVRPDGAVVLSGNVLASTETVEEIAADSDVRERRAAFVAGAAFAVALITLIVGAVI